MKLFGSDHFRSSLRHFLLGRAMQGGLAILLTLVTIRVMTPVDYGVYLVLVGLIDLLRPLSSLGVLPTVQRFLPEMALHASTTQLRKFVRISRLVRWGLLILLVLFLYLFWQQLIVFVGITSVTQLTVVLVCIVICSVLALEYAESMQEALLDQRAAQTARVIHVVLRLCSVVFLGASGLMSVDLLLACEAVAALFALGIAEFSLGRRIHQLQPDGTKRFTRDEILSFSFHLSISQILNTLATPGVLRILVARQLGVEAAGQFGFMQSLLQQLNKLMPSLLLANLVSPMLIAARARGQLAKLSEASGLLFKSNVLLVWPIVPAMVLVGNDLMLLVSGGRLVDQGYPMAALMLSLSAMTQMQVAAIVLQVNRMSRTLALAGLLSVLAPSFVFLGGSDSLLFACLGLFLATSARYMFTMTLIQRSSAKVTLDLRGSIRYLGALAVAFLVARQVLPVSTWASLLVFTIVVLLLMPLVKPISGGEARVFKEALRRDVPLARWIVSTGRG